MKGDGYCGGLVAAVSCGRVCERWTWGAGILLTLMWVLPVRAQSVVYPGFPSSGASAVVRSGNTLIVGGATPLQRSLGAGLPFDTTTGSADESFPTIDGDLYTVAADGAGGWYLGGNFRAVGGQVRNNLAHVLADNSIGAWAPEPDGTVRTLVLADGSVFVGGEFTHVGGAARPFLARLDAETGLTSTWAPEPDSSVRKLVREAGTLYVLGGFRAIGGVARRGLAAVDLASGTVQGWDPQPDGTVTGIDPAGGLVYLCGEFLNVGGQPRSHVACLDATTGLATAWAPSVNGAVSAIAVSDTSAYLCGNFITFMRGRTLGGLVEFDLLTAQPTTELVLIDYDFPVVLDQVEVAGGLLRMAGGVWAQGFSTAGAYLMQFGLVTWDLASHRLTEWAPPTKAFAHAFASAGNTLLVGGEHHLFTSEPQDFGHLAAIDIRSGVGSGLNLKVWGDAYMDYWYGKLVYLRGHVRALAVSGTTLYLGGRFSRIESANGDTTLRRNLAAVDLTTGQLLPWDPDASGPKTCLGDGATVTSMAIRGNTVIVGGRFDRVGGAARKCLAALDAVSGVATEWNPAPDDSVSCVLSRDNVVYVAGSFSRIGGVPRSGLAALDATARDSTDGITTAWNPAPRPEPAHGWIDSFCLESGVRFAPVRTMAFHGPTLLVGGSFTRMGGDFGPLRAGLAELDTTTGSVTPWAPPVTGSVTKVVVDGPVAYLAGDFQAVGGQPRNGVAAVSLSTGVPDPWNPNDRPAALSPFERKFDLLVEGGTAIAFGSFQDFGPYPQAGLAFMHDIDSPVELALESAQEQSGHVKLVWIAQDGRKRQARLYRRVGVGPWLPLGFLTTGDDDRLRYEDADVSIGGMYGYRLGVTRPGTEEYFGETSLTLGVVGPNRGVQLELRQNPARKQILAEFALPDGGPARLDLLDVSGRLISSRSVGGVGAGSQVVNLSAGDRTRPGLYFVRLERAGVRLVRRVVLLP